MPVTLAGSFITLAGLFSGTTASTPGSLDPQDLQQMRVLFGLDRAIPIVASKMLAHIEENVVLDAPSKDCLVTLLGEFNTKKVDESLQVSIQNKAQFNEWISFNRTVIGARVMDAYRRDAIAVFSGGDSSAVQDISLSLTVQEKADIGNFMNNTRAGTHGFPKLLKMSEADTQELLSGMANRCGLK